jgi:serine protease
MTRFLPFLFLLFCLPIAMQSQQLHHVQGQVLVQLQPDISARHWLVGFHQKHPEVALQLEKAVVRPSNIWLLSFDYDLLAEDRVLALLQQENAVAIAQLNHLVQLRETIPNDPQFDQQWQYINTGQTDGLPGADLDADLAWDLTTGGLTALGDTIVVCILDNGIDVDHPDLVDNLWINHAEIPDNGIDDDNNGYIDDYQGWSIATDDDDIEGGSHGTSVMGIVGARGNNNIGISGVNWNVKIMVVFNDFETNEADVLEAYSYPLEQRQRYNATNGAEGAFVVATNASWGADNLFASEAPLWCAFYDTLGVHGIINVGATANSNTNVDTDGDMPTSCGSDYLITVTNLDENNEKVAGAGFGATTIDLAAYGNFVYTTRNDAQYGAFPGTSAATPQVTGVAGLLYAADCPDFIQIARQSPATAALLAKDYILGSAIATDDLQGITVTGGRLNMWTSLQALLNNCGACLDPADLNAVSETETTATLSWTAFNNHTRIDLRWRELGAPFWNNLTDVATPLELNGLTACTDYEFQLKGYCDGEELPFTSSFFFITEGCCDLPEMIEVNNINFEAAFLNWSDVVAAQNYTVRFRQDPGDTWTQFTTTQSNFPFINLMPCTDYQAQIRTNCAGIISEFSPIITFTTLGCGGCIDLPFCTDFGLDTSEEWIESVQLHTLFNESGNDGGYGDYTGLPALQLVRGETYDLMLEPEHSGVMWGEYFLVWIDFNQNGTFQQSEIVFDPNDSFNETVSGTFTIPEDAMTGNTRLRVAMQFLTAGGPCTFPEGFGEVEDYCVDIIAADACEPPNDLTRLDAIDDMVTLEWPAFPNADTYLFRYRPTSGGAWIEETVSENVIVLSGLDTCTTYSAEMRSNCAGVFSSVSAGFTFDSYCLTNVNTLLEEEKPQAFPNPFRESISIQLPASWNTRPISVTLTDVTGQVVLQQQLIDGSPLHPGAIPKGVYFLRLQHKTQLLGVVKLVKL